MKMTLMQHFAELRRRILWILFIFLVMFVVGWILTPVLQEFLTEPLMNIWPDGKMLYTGLMDGVMIQFSLSTLFAIIVTIPAVLWHLWAFVSPGLRDSEKRMILPILLLSPILFIIGAAFAFYIMFPLVFKFFVELNLSSSVPSVLMPSMTNYLAFSISMLKVFGIVFQMPLILVLLNRLGILSREIVIKSQRYVIVIIFVLAAVLTPGPDVVSQLVLAIPMLALFEISILFMNRKPK